MEATKVVEPKISIIMPTYNYAHFIGESVKSVLAQTYENWELIIIDNHSEDNTEEVAESFNDPRIKYIKFRNRGVIAASRNVGIRQATGYYIAFLDSDDLWAPHKLKRVAEYLNNHPDTVFVHHRYNTLRNNEYCFHRPLSESELRMRSGNICEHLLLENFVAILTVVVKREVFDNAGFFDERPVLKGSEDWDLWLRIARKYRVDYLNETLASYRQHEAASSRNIEKMIACKYDVISRYIINDKNISEPVQKRSLSMYHAKVANYYIMNGNMKKARAEVLKSISLAPLDLKICKIFVKTLLGQKIVSFLQDLKQKLFS